MKILVLCTGNSCRSQMAHGFLQSFNKNMVVRSAGTEPAARVNPTAIRVMRESGIDISRHKPESVDQYKTEEWDYVITVCDHANETCPVFSGKSKKQAPYRIRRSFPCDRYENYILGEFRRVRDEIKNAFYELYTNQIKPRL